MQMAGSPVAHAFKNEAPSPPICSHQNGTLHSLMRLAWLQMPLAVPFHAWHTGMLDNTVKNVHVWGFFFCIPVCRQEMVKAGQVKYGMQEGGRAV